MSSPPGIYLHVFRTIYLSIHPSVCLCVSTPLVAGIVVCILQLRTQDMKNESAVANYPTKCNNAAIFFKLTFEETICQLHTTHTK